MATREWGVWYMMAALVGFNSPTLYSQSVNYVTSTILVLRYISCLSVALHAPLLTSRARCSVKCECPMQIGEAYFAWGVTIVLAFVPFAGWTSVKRH